MAIFTGETVEDAIERGLNRLNVKRENVHIPVSYTHLDVYKRQR